MANPRVSIYSKKICSKCDKGSGAFSCDGCQQSFCLKHVAEHRQELISQMDNIVLEHDITNEDLVNRTKNQSKHLLFERINQWEKESIDKIEHVANESRAQLNQILDNIIDHGKKELNKLSTKFYRARECDDFFENDLARWTQDLNHLRAEIECMTNNINIVNDNSSSMIKLIKILHDETTENTEGSWPGNFSWFSDMKAFLYDRSRKLSINEDNEKKKYSTQTCTKGSIAIIKVNNIDQYVDIENDGDVQQDQNISGWILRRDANRKTKIIYKFPENFILKSRSSIRIYCGIKRNIDKENIEILVHEDSKPWDAGSH
ncbi:hypothetical protein I4U23_028464 [Adineta vaga]|nr:hypothetical protein I4U23_028464 [Adineta vaga]